MDEKPVFMIRDLDFYYGSFKALSQINLDIMPREVTALIGPSGCGKSTFLRCLNRMNDSIESARVTGTITLDGQDIYSGDLDPVALRARVGMVFQKPNPFPKSIYDNVAYGPRIHGLAADRAELDDIVHTSLDRAGLLKEVKDRMDEPGTGLSGGQQQRVFIARALGVEPRLLLLDEPTISLDACAQDELYELMEQIKKGLNLTVLMVSHDVGSVARHVEDIVCLNRRVHVHQPPPLGRLDLESTFGCSVEYLFHGEIPHRVVRLHDA